MEENNVLVGGIDIGSLTGKMVLLKDDKIKHYKIILARPTPRETTDELFKHVFNDETGIKLEDVEYIVGTGYGRRKIPQAQKTISEITCHGKGAFWINQKIRTIIDIGGQDCKVIRMTPDGELDDFVMNEKCAAGTGRYLEIMADLLKVSLDELGTIGEKVKHPLHIMNICSIYAAQEVAQAINDGIKPEKIAAGVNFAMAERVAMMAKRVNVQPEVAFTGGVAKNQGIVKYLSKLLDVKFQALPIDPQIMGAVGAALIARERKLSEIRREKEK
ncbi:MAG: acyl-CoA dehydratase activase [Candidatus Helarchaeota archaeon]